VTLAAQAVDARASLASRGAVNDGLWHHVLAEADRKARTFTIYIDGRQDARSAATSTLGCTAAGPSRCSGP
jgi:hypothetical protein